MRSSSSSCVRAPNWGGKSQDRYCGRRAGGRGGDESGRGEGRRERARAQQAAAVSPCSRAPTHPPTHLVDDGQVQQAALGVAQVLPDVAQVAGNALEPLQPAAQAGTGAGPRAAGAVEHLASAGQGAGWWDEEGPAALKQPLPLPPHSMPTSRAAPACLLQRLALGGVQRALHLVPLHRQLEHGTVGGADDCRGTLWRC